MLKINDFSVVVYCTRLMCLRTRWLLRRSLVKLIRLGYCSFVMFSKVITTGENELFGSAGGVDILRAASVHVRC